MNFRLSNLTIFFALFIPAFLLCNYNETQPIKGKIFKPVALESLEQMLNRYDIVVVDFYADWCSPCKQMHKVIEALAQDKDLDSILFIQINTDTHPAISSKYRISSLPTIIVCIDGKPLRSLHGYQSKTALKSILMEIIRYHRGAGVGDGHGAHCPEEEL